MGEEAERSESIVERDDDRALLRERRGVVAFFAAESGPESAAMNPHQHRAACGARIERIRPNVEVEAIFRDAGGERIDVAVRLVLDAIVAELTCGPRTVPAGSRAAAASSAAHRRAGRRK